MIRILSTGVLTMLTLATRVVLRHIQVVNVSRRPEKISARRIAKIEKTVQCHMAKARKNHS